MKKFLTPLLLLPFHLLFSQETKACKCSSLRKVQDSVKMTTSGKHFSPVSKEEALVPPFDYISVQSLPSLKKGSLSDQSSTYSTSTATIAEIPANFIIKAGKLDNMHAVLYTVDTSINSSQYYLKISQDNGKTWKNYFTGLTVNTPYYFKLSSRYPLWKDKNTLQIEGSIRRMTKLPFPLEKPIYETIEDNSLITLNLNEIMKDSDGDGINDIKENRILFTDPYAKDTDGDDINDAEDSNPRYKNSSSDFTKLMQGILYVYYPFVEHPDPGHEEFNIPLATFDEDVKRQQEETPVRKNNFMSSLQYKIIVTDDEHLKRVLPLNEKTIFLSPKEYETYKSYNHINTSEAYYSQLFRCDDLPDTYILWVDGIMTGYTYLIKRTAEGWNVQIIEHWIS